ncbi:MAG: hypothetical protein M1826_000368 [Phylliscum demangeonii]|nr:MAG: hypothetical protein M1826_000368 [Phylliscum demangeonii]
MPARAWIGPRPPVLRRMACAINEYIAPVNFITLHYLYFIGVCLVASGIFWGAATPAGSISYPDALLHCVSAMTLAGLNTLLLSTFNSFQQALLFVLMVMGSAILVSAVVVHVRRKAFDVRFHTALQAQARRQRAERDANPSPRRRLFLGRPPARPSSEGRGAPPAPFAFDAHEKSHEITAASPTAVEPPASGDASCATTHEPMPPAVSHDPPRPHVGGGAAARITFDPSSLAPSPSPSPAGPALSPRPRRRHHARLLSNLGVGASPRLIHPVRSLRAHRSSGGPATTTATTHPDAADGMLPSRARISRSSRLHLRHAERARIGGVEYKALSVLRVIVPLYFVAWQLLGAIGLGAYMAHNKADVARQNGVHPWWAGSFIAISAFNNCGLSLLDANMASGPGRVEAFAIPFDTSYYMLLTASILILAGNTCFPVFLRLIIWTLGRLLPYTPYADEWAEAVSFLLEHPRRCYTNLFPAPHTWWLLLSIVVLNAIDTVAFVVLNVGNARLAPAPARIRVLDGFAQAIAVRSAGFAVASIASLRIGSQLLYVLMMYISVFPVVITLRNSNVYEERSLGIYPGAHPPPRAGPRSSSASRSFVGRLKGRLTGRFTGASATATAAPSARARPPGVRPSYFVSQQLRAQLAHDLWWIVLAILFIVIIETGQFERDPVVFAAFNFIFEVWPSPIHYLESRSLTDPVEVVSAYGCVGLSTGLPDRAYSFCGSWHVLSKLILCAVMIRGRHRGLPVAIDRAVLLPGDDLRFAGDDEDEDGGGDDDAFSQSGTDRSSTVGGGGGGDGGGDGDGDGDGECDPERGEEV